MGVLTVPFLDALEKFFDSARTIGLDVEEGATPGKMMGMPTLHLGGQAFAGLYGNGMVFRLDGAAHAKALALGGAALFDPSGMGRPMKAWVQVRQAPSSEWVDLARAAANGIAAAG